MALWLPASVWVDLLLFNFPINRCNTSFFQCGAVFHFHQRNACIRSCRLLFNMVRGFFLQPELAGSGSKQCNNCNFRNITFDDTRDPRGPRPFATKHAGEDVGDEPTDFAIFLIGNLLPFHTYRHWRLPYWNVQQSQTVDRLGSERQSIR